MTKHSHKKSNIVRQISGLTRQEKKAFFEENLSQHGNKLKMIPNLIVNYLHKKIEGRKVLAKFQQKTISIGICYRKI